MAYRVLVDIKNTMVKSIISIGAQLGVSAVTARRIAKMCNISTFTVFEHFKTKQNYLDYAARTIDTPRMLRTKQMSENGMPLEDIWDVMLEDFIASPNDTLYYISYTNTFGFDPTDNNSRSRDFLPVAKAIFARCVGVTDNELLLKWDYLTSMAFYYAEKIIHGYIPNTAQSKTAAKAIIFNGVFAT